MLRGFLACHRPQCSWMQPHSHAPIWLIFTQPQPACSLSSRRIMTRWPGWRDAIPTPFPPIRSASRSGQGRAGPVENQLPAHRNAGIGQHLQPGCGHKPKGLGALEHPPEAFEVSKMEDHEDYHADSQKPEQPACNMAVSTASRRERLSHQSADARNWSRKVSRRARYPSASPYSRN